MCRCEPNSNSIGCMRFRLRLSLILLAFPGFASARGASAQRGPTAADTVAIVGAVLDHIRSDFPPDSVVVDPHSASGKRLPLDSLVVRLRGRVAAEKDILQCRAERPDTCHLGARLLLRVDSLLIREQQAEVFLHFWKPADSKLMPVAQLLKRFYVEKRDGRWHFARADRRVRVTDNLLHPREQFARDLLRREATAAGIGDSTHGLSPSRTLLLRCAQTSRVSS